VSSATLVRLDSPFHLNSRCLRTYADGKCEYETHYVQGEQRKEVYEEMPEGVGYRGYPMRVRDLLSKHWTDCD
jgi:hypothetical protein